ncbi:MAG: response regulator transcription factor [Chitinophagaceae bacterium]|jgi:DNA-binding LytR/AlgR family response regulator|nr:MAG: response regulator transcription factor [Chitinophagaceae bacterium]
MRKLSCIITDDEPVARKVLKEFIEQIPYLQLTGQFENVRKTDLFLKENKADVLLLDIQMPGITGLEYLKNVTMQPLVILTTAYPNYALEGYELNIIDYLLKPIAFDRFTKAMQKAKEYTELREAPLGSHQSPWLFVRSEKRIEKVELKDILYIESLGNYVNICTTGRNIIAYLTLKGIESQLPANEFIKIHQSYLVNFSKIDSIEGNHLKIGDKSLVISRNYKDELMQMVEQKLLRR